MDKRDFTCSHLAFFFPSQTTPRIALTEAFRGKDQQAAGVSGGNSPTAQFALKLVLEPPKDFKILPFPASMKSDGP